MLQQNCAISLQYKKMFIPKIRSRSRYKHMQVRSYITFLHYFFSDSFIWYYLGWPWKDSHCCSRSLTHYNSNAKHQMLCSFLIMPSINLVNNRRRIDPTHACISIMIAFIITMFLFHTILRYHHIDKSKKISISVSGCLGVTTSDIYAIYVA